MPYTFGNLKAELRPVIFPTGEAKSLVVAHNKAFLDAIIDLQTWVECLQYDNVSIFPQCSTYYQCGVTVIPAPRGTILKVSVIDKINPTTHKEDPLSPDDWCSEIAYAQVDFCHIRTLLHNAVRGSCCSIPLFFGLNCRKGSFPTPTDAGLSGLAALPLGFHYGQTSTDDPHGRASAGVWAIDRGKLYITPWIQSTESIIVKWDGLKRAWTDDDPIDDDPKLKLAVEEYVRWQHAAKYDRDEIEAARANAAYNVALQNLMHDCREETRIRGCEGSRARQSGTQTGQSTTPLFYNTQQQATASCPGDQTGNPITITIPANTVASTVSVADANQKAFNEAQQQANAQLDCAANAPTFTNDAQSYTAQCQSGEVGAPAPDGNPVSVTIPAGTVTSTISKSDANQQALVLAQQQATAQLNCTFWNAEQSYTASCPAGQTGASVTITVAAHVFSSTVSQADADAQALNSAKTQAEAQIVCNGSNGVFYNTLQFVSTTKLCNILNAGGTTVCQVVVNVTVNAGKYTSLISILDANQQARAAGMGFATAQAISHCNLKQCGTFSYTI